MVPTKRRGKNNARWNSTSGRTNLDFLRLVDTLLVVADVEVILHVEQFVDVRLLLTCHLVISIIVFHSAYVFRFSKTAHCNTDRPTLPRSRLATLRIFFNLIISFFSFFLLLLRSFKVDPFFEPSDDLIHERTFSNGVSRVNVVSLFIARHAST